MGPSPAPELLPIPLPGKMPEAVETLPITGNPSADPTEGSAGLFAVLLGQLTLETPVAGPVVPETPPAFPPPRPVGAEGLPVAGNVLPHPVVITERETDTAPAPIYAGGDAARRGAIPPFPGLPRPAPDKPLSAAPVRQHAPLPVTPAPAARPAIAPTTPTPVAIEPETRLPGRVAPTPVTQEMEPSPELRSPLAARPSAAIADGVAPPAVGTTAPMTSPGTPVAGTQPTYTLERPVADARWSESLGQRVMWMSDNGVGRAEIRLNPPELGPLEVRISVASDEARVAFTVQHGVTREAVEAAMPRLREMFAAQGIDLTDASVSQHSPGDRRQAADSGDDATRAAATPESSTGGEIDGDDRLDGNAHEGLIDTYV